VCVRLIERHRARQRQEPETERERICVVERDGERYRDRIRDSKTKEIMCVIERERGNVCMRERVRDRKKEGRKREWPLYKFNKKYLSINNALYIENMNKSFNGAIMLS